MDGPADPPLSLADVSYAGGRMTWPDRRQRMGDDALADVLEAGRQVLQAGARRDGERPATSADFEHLRWFPLPDEAVTESR